MLVLALTAPALPAAMAPVTPDVWHQAVVSVHALDRSAEFFVRIGGYESIWRGSLDASEVAAWSLPDSASGEALLLAAPGYETGFLRLVRFDTAGRREPMRPGSRAWDTGCYFSLMVRMRGMQSIYDDAIRLGWWTETPVTYLEFGASKLNVVIYRGPDGLQLQGYQRLSPPLPEAIGPFERMSGPFNVMQMVRDRDIAWRFFADVLGFDTFYRGEPVTAAEPAPMPLGIPINLTTEIAWRAAIVYPEPGEFGRMEMIEIMGLEGSDYSDRCVAPNLGILALRYPVDDAAAARDLIASRGGSPGELSSFVVEPYGEIEAFDVVSPDGAIIQFFEQGGGQAR